MKKNIHIIFFFFNLFIMSLCYSQVEMNFKFNSPYGKNDSIGKYANVNGIKMYYEEYGSGEPLFLVHGNGGSILSMGNQIEYFKSKYRVIVADSRGHGKSELKTDSLNYDQIAKDWVDLANHLKIDSINIIGWSDGGIIGLLIGINYPNKVKKLITMGANLRPDTTAVYPWAVNYIKKRKIVVNQKIKEKDTTKNWSLLKQYYGLVGDQPNISVSDLSKIKAPVLLIAGDKDIIREEHTIEIFQNIHKAHLCILPGETHFTPASNPILFNEVANKFLSEPYKRPHSDWTKQ